MFLNPLLINLYLFKKRPVLTGVAIIGVAIKIVDVQAFSCHFRFLDRAAIPTDGDLTESGKPDLWKLSTVHRIEELKSIIRMIPIWSVGILITTATSHNHSFVIMQAKSMDRRLTSHFQIPAASMSIFSIASMLLGLALYDRVFVPLARKFTNRPNGITYLQRMGIGLAISLAANVAAALVETRRKEIAAEGNQMNVFWLVPQYAIHGFAEAFTSVGHLEFLYDQSPESMRSTAVAFFSLAGSIGSYFGTALVTIVSGYTKKRGNNWLQDDLNKGKLDYYYWLVTVLQVLNFGYYLVCAKFYRFKTLEVEEDKEADVELAKLEKKSKDEDFSSL